MTEFVEAGLEALTSSPSPAPAGEARRAFRFSLVLLLFGLVSAFSVTSARADGEAGLVIQNGDTTTTYCVPFKGDSISGSDLLAASGLGYEQFGGAARTVCSIGGTGCANAATFDGCFCQCQGANCTYWAFFTQKYGEGWVYSSLAFNLLRAKDGDVQGWKWGRGSPSNAPVPNPVTFEGICGHGPRGGAELPPTMTPTLVPTQRPPAATATAVSSSPTAPALTATAAAPATATEPGSPGPATPASPDSNTDAASPEATPSTADAIGTVTVTNSLTRPATVLAPAAGDPAGNGDGSGLSGLIAFAVVAGILVVGTAGALFWRRHNGP